MAFGQQGGPPASARQVDEIAQLLEQAGYASFREARHMVGLTQRQAAGKFTQAEAVELIERLEREQEAGDEGAAAPGEQVAGGRSAPEVAPDRAARRRADRRAEVLVGIPSEELADELVRRGWMCMPPA
jgi:hypothetical protein